MDFTPPLSPFTLKPMKLRFNLPGDWREKENFGENFQVYWCANSGYGCLSPQPGKTRLRQAYGFEDYYTHASSDVPVEKKISFFDKLRVWLAWRADRSRTLNAQWLTHYCGKSSHLNICEIGCGNGNTLKELASLDNRVIGVEPDEKARTVAQNSGIEVLSGTAENLPEALSAGSYDLVIMNHVFEHVYDPLSALRNAGKLLSPKGILVVEVPNCESLGLKSSGIAWVHLDVPRHLHFFTEKSLCLFAKKAGFEKIQSEFVHYTRQFKNSWIDLEKSIWERHAAHFVASSIETGKNSKGKSWLLLLKTFFSANPRKYDSVRVILRRASN
jgi:2-polyprenyl-3-methyl-5-hydroxy-6-metoxy-1,4-benzoquinol methylase